MAEELERAGFDRRSMLKKAAIGAGVVWAAPVMDAVIASPAAAATSGQTCYWVKADEPGTTLTDLGGADQCAPKPAGTVSGGGGSVVWSNSKPGESGEYLSVTVNVPSGCMIQTIVLKAGSTVCESKTGEQSNSQLVTLVDQSKAISHVTVHYCCP